jgi:hypothetical protein
LPAFSINVTDAPNTAPSISGTPATSVEEGSVYSFTPTAKDPDGDALRFTISGKPAWASFDTALGTLSGVPSSADVGTYSNIVIRASDGELTSALPAFSINVTDAPNTAPSISGKPPSSVEVNTTYSFTPSASDPEGDALTFSVSGLPSWAAFNASTGRISGTPMPGDENIYRNIVITVSDGELTDSLDPFSIEVSAAESATGSVTLSWTAPTQNEDGSSLTDLAGFKLYWGATPGNYTESVTIDNASVTTYLVEGLAPGTYEFVATSFNERGTESRPSAPATKIVQ